MTYQAWKREGDLTDFLFADRESATAYFTKHLDHYQRFSHRDTGCVFGYAVEIDERHGREHAVALLIKHDTAGFIWIDVDT